MKLNKITLSLIVVLIAIAPIFSQSVNKLGISYRIGFSQNLEFEESNSNFLVSGSIPSTGSYLYVMLRTGKDSIPRIIPFIKVSAGSSSRSGIFEINNNLTKISSTFIDVETIIPIAFRFSKEVDIYLGAGPVLSFMVQQSSSMNSPTAEKDDVFQPGLAFEAGIMNRFGSSFGFNLSNSFSDYALQNISVHIEISLANLKDSVQKSINQRRR